MKEKIEDTVIGILLIGVFIFIMGVAGYIETHYTREATVVKINEDEIIVEDSIQHHWVFYGEDYKIGDKIKMTMFNNYTDSNIYDDKIIKVKKVVDK